MPKCLSGEWARAALEGLGRNALGPRGDAGLGGYSSRAPRLARSLGIAVRELQGPRYSLFLPQKGSWALAPAENPPKLSALEMLENSLYSPTWEGRCLRCLDRDGVERKGVLGKGVIKVRDPWGSWKLLKLVSK